MYNLLRIQCITLITVLSFITGTASLAWCQHYGVDNNNHIIRDKTDHGEAHNYSYEHMASKQSTFVTSCSDHSHDCVHISFVQQPLVSNNALSIVQSISSLALQPAPFQDNGWYISLTAANEPFRSSSVVVPPGNLQLASLQTIVLRN